MRRINTYSSGSRQWLRRGAPNLNPTEPSTPPPVTPPSPPPPPAGTANEFGWSRAEWVRPSGVGYQRWEDLYTTNTTNTFQKVIDKVTDHNALTFPEGLFEFSDFTAAAGTAGLHIGANCKGLVGSGPNTVIRMKPKTSTKADLVPAQAEAPATNPLWMIRIRDHHDTVYRGFQFEGTDQGHLYNGLGVQWSNNHLSSHLYLRAASWGDNKTPPGETFSWGNNRANNCRLYDSEIDGRTPGGLLVGASAVGWNNSTDADMRRVYAHHSRAGMPTWWQTVNIYTEDCIHWFSNMGCGYNHENASGKIRHVRPTWVVAGKYSDRRLGTSSSLHLNLGNATQDVPDITIIDPVYDRNFHKSGGLCISMYEGWNVGGQGLNKIRTYPKVFHKGVQTTVYNGRTVANPGSFVKRDSFVYN